MPRRLVRFLAGALLGAGSALAQTWAQTSDLTAAPPRSVHDTMDYGPRAGMEVSIVGMAGRDTAHASIRFKHTRDNAIAYCRDYVRDVTEECIRETLAGETRFKEALTANCESGEFADFTGVRYRFLGTRPGAGYFDDDKYLIEDLDTGEMVDRAIASWYLTTLNVYRALCPAHAPIDMDAMVLGMKGRDTATAAINVEHRPEDAVHACQQRGTLPAERVTEDCIRQEHERRTRDLVTADCTSGEFTDYYGRRFKASLNTHQVYPVSKLNIVNLQTGEIVDPYSPDYAIRQPLPIYRALCPAHAPI
jgi:hypothetical protein